MELVQYIIINNSLGMNKGKIAAQACHASVLVLEKVDDAIIDDWKNQGMKKIVLKINSTDDLIKKFQFVKEKKLPVALITDAGKTQIAPGSKTCFACGPIDEKIGQVYFSDLKLL
ncbi:MAG: aminoacyl-tRNA hydrolase [Candidatus ainarchaeum sp.]|nr:aminoacyl-tRNA hydrolase [Candidatus ainarchaeum sp.]